MDLNETYWTEKYLNGQTGWDIGYPSPAILEYFNQVADKTVKILIPGGGNGYEAAALWKMGFKNVVLLDISKAPLEAFRETNPEFPQDQLIQIDYFKFKGQFDYIIEQTFFCALAPVLRNDYVKHTADILKEDGLLIGLLFNLPLNDNQPPFGGSKKLYEPLFEECFKILKMEVCINSIAPRQGNELFIKMRPLKG